MDVKSTEGSLVRSPGQALFLVFLVFALSGGGSAGGTLSTGRSVIAYSDSAFLTSQLTADTAIIETAGKTIVVRPTVLLVDGSEVATIPASVADVRVVVEDGFITFFADGEVVPTTLR